MIQTVDAALFKSMIISGAALLEQHKQQINDLNVFPVPDGDTGTNMSLTINSGVTALSRMEPETVSQVADAAASALLRGARGNSGVITSLLFRGISKSLKGKRAMNSFDFAQALMQGVNAAYKAVMRPTEGTILTVSRLASDAAVSFAETSEDLEAMLETMIAEGERALAETTEQNPVLKKAGVIDAGGAGYIYLLKGMYSALQGNPIVFEAGEAVEEKADFGLFSTEEITFAFDTVFIVRKTVERSLDPLRSYLGSIGDSLVIGEDDEAFKVHVHTNTPGDALTEAQKYGTLELAKIENMRTQHDDLAAGRKAKSTDDLTDDFDEYDTAAGPEKKYGVVAVCAGEGLEDVFRNLGADAIVTGGQTMNPSTEDILHAVASVPAETVFVFPNNKNIIMAAEQTRRLTDKKVIVIPTRTVPQGITSLISFDADSDEEALTAALTEAAATVHTVQITYAARDSEFDGSAIKAGEYLALLEGSLITSEADTGALFEKVTERLKEFSPEVLTIFYGEDVNEDTANGVLAKFESEFPGADVTMVNGRQPVYYYMISAE